MSLRAERDPAGGLLDRLAGSVGARAGAVSVFGAPIEREGITVIPVARSRYGFGGGGGGGRTPDGRGQGAGGGGGAVSRPLGFIEIRGDRARFRRVSDPVAFAMALLAAALAVAILVRVARRLGGACRGYARRRAAEPPDPEASPDT